MHYLKMYFLAVMLMMGVVSIGADSHAKITLQPQYETTIREVLTAFLAGNYADVEEFFQTNHKNGTLTPAGGDPFDVFMGYVFRQDTYLSKDVLQHVEGWEKAYPKSVFARAAHAEYNYHVAWKYRGNSWSKNVDQNDGMSYGEHLRVASSLFKEAQQLDPTVSFPYAKMIAMIGEMAPREKKRDLASAVYKEAIKHNVAYKHSMHRIITTNILGARWGGNDEAQLAFARQKAKEAPEKSEDPYLVVIAHEDIANYRWHQKNYKAQVDYLNDPAVWKEITDAYEALFKAFPTVAKWKLFYAETAHMANKMDLAGRMLNLAYDADKTFTLTYITAIDMFLDDTKNQDFLLHAVDELLAIRQDNPYPYYARAKVFYDRKQYKEAIDSADSAIKLTQEDSLVWKYRCLSNLALDKKEQALKDCNKAVEYAKGKTGPYKARASVYRALGKEKEAKADEATAESFK